MATLDKNNKLQKKERIEAFENVVYSQLDLAWANCSFAARLGSIPIEEAEEIYYSCFEEFLADLAVTDGFSKKDFLENLSAAYDRVKEEADAEAAEGEIENEEEDEAPPEAEVLNNAIKNANAKANGEATATETPSVEVPKAE